MPEKSVPSLERIEEELEAIDKRIALVVLPAVKDVRRRLHTLTVLVWCQIAALIIGGGVVGVVIAVYVHE